MKKTFGIIFLILGVILGIAGLMILSDHSGDYSYDGGDLGGISYRSSAAHERELTGGALGLLGIILFIIGLVMVSTKSKSQREKEAELKVLKNMQHKESSPVHIKTGPDTQELAKQVASFYRQKNYNAAIVALKKLCEVEPYNSKWFYDLACVQSLNQDIEAGISLLKAIELGYGNPDKVQNDPDLNWLRNQPGFDKIVSSHKKTTVNNPVVEPQKTESNLDILTQLEKLGKLKEAGILTDEEFMEQKRRILSNQ